MKSLNLTLTPLLPAIEMFKIFFVKNTPYKHSRLMGIFSQREVSSEYSAENFLALCLGAEAGFPVGVLLLDSLIMIDFTSAELGFLHIFLDWKILVVLPNQTSPFTFPGMPGLFLAFLLQHLTIPHLWDTDVVLFLLPFSICFLEPSREKTNI